MPLFRPGIPYIDVNLSADAAVASAAPIPFNVLVHSEQFPTPLGLGTLVIPRSGTYLLTARWILRAYGSSVTRTVGFRVNGFDTAAVDRYANTAAEIRGSLAALVRCAAGDQVFLTVAYPAGPTMTVGAPNTNMRIARVGPERWTG